MDEDVHDEAVRVRTGQVDTNSNVVVIKNLSKVRRLSI